MSLILEKKDLKFFSIQSKILILYGSYMEHEKNTKWNRLRSLFNSLIYPPVMIPLGYGMWMGFPDITILIALMGLFIGFLSSSFKLPTLHFRIKHFVEIRTRVLKLYERIQPGEEGYLEKIVIFVRRLALANGILLVVGSALLVSGPLIYAVVMKLYFAAEDINWPAPFDIGYFVDMEKPLNYILINIWCLYTLLLCVIMNNCIDCIFFESCMFAAANFRILQRRFQKLNYN